MFDLGLYTPRLELSSRRPRSPVPRQLPGGDDRHRRQFHLHAEGWPRHPHRHSPGREGPDRTAGRRIPCTRLLRRFTGAAVTDAAKQLVDEQVAAYHEAAKEFTTGPERDFAKHFSSSFLE